MELYRNSNSLNYEDNTKLLFFENYKNDKSQYNIEEIFFKKPVILQQIRILKLTQYLTILAIWKTFVSIEKNNICL